MIRKILNNKKLGILAGAYLFTLVSLVSFSTLDLRNRQNLNPSPIVASQTFDSNFLEQAGADKVIDELNSNAFRPTEEIELEEHQNDKDYEDGKVNGVMTDKKINIDELIALGIDIGKQEKNENIARVRSKGQHRRGGGGGGRRPIITPPPPQSTTPNPTPVATQEAPKSTPTATIEATPIPEVTIPTGSQLALPLNSTYPYAQKFGFVIDSPPNYNQAGINIWKDLVCEFQDYSYVMLVPDSTWSVRNDYSRGKDLSASAVSYLGEIYKQMVSDLSNCVNHWEINPINSYLSKSIGLDEVEERMDLVLSMLLADPQLQSKTVTWSFVEVEGDWQYDSDARDLVYKHLKAISYIKENRPQDDIRFTFHFGYYNKNGDFTDIEAYTDAISSVMQNIESDNNFNANEKSVLRDFYNSGNLKVDEMGLSVYPYDTTVDITTVDMQNMVDYIYNSSVFDSRITKFAGIDETGVMQDAQADIERIERCLKTDGICDYNYPGYVQKTEYGIKPWRVNEGIRECSNGNCFHLNSIKSLLRSWTTQ